MEKKREDGKKIIKVSNLSRNYSVIEKQEKNRILGRRSRKTIYAVKGISFEICEGESVGFIGPNGAGKSTTIKMLTGILHPTDGSVEVLGREPYKYRKENAQHIGVV